MTTITGPGAVGETFDLVFSGSVLPSASSFLTASTPTSSNRPSYLAIASILNAAGSGNGVGYIGVASVPEPSAWALLAVGAGAFGCLARRPKNRPD